MSKRHQHQALLDYRGCSVRAATVDAEGRSVEATFTTETPTPMWDWERWEMIPEVLRMDGAEWPQQVPFLNAHSRSKIGDMLGSGRQIRTEGPAMIGRLHFGKSASDAFEMVRDGHVTDVSVGYQVIDRVFVPKGEKAIVMGREYEGPVSVATKWKLKEISLVPIGADEQAKLRGFDQFPHPKKENFTVNKELRELCIKLGMKADASEDEAQAFLTEIVGKKVEKRAAKEAAKEGGGDPPAAQVAIAIDEARLASALEKVIEGREQKAKQFRAEVEQMCELASLGPDVARAAIDTGDLTKARAFILEAKAKANEPLPFSPTPIFGGESQRDKHTAELRTAVVLKAFDNTGYVPHQRAANGVDKDHRLEVFKPEERAKTGDHFRNFSLLQIAEECLRCDGYSDREVRSLTKEQLAIAAMGFTSRAGLRPIYMRATNEPAYNVTGTFNLITQDAQNKAMMLGYTEYPATWRGPFRQAASVQDFKNINRYRLGGLPNLPIWPDNSDPTKASMGQAREQYAVEAYSLEIGFSYRLLINDDMDALSRTPFQLGNAASRTVNAAAWGQITGNPLMSDGQVLFLANATGNRKRSNLTTGAAVPTTATVQTLTNKMMQMRGENTPEGNEGADILNLQPRFIIGPSALRTTILQLVLSVYDPAANEFMVYNTATQLIPVIEPLLDANSTTAFYLAASPAQIDTVEVTFLAGQEAPIIRDWMDERNLTRNSTVLQTFAAKAMNHRGLQRHDGA